MSQDPQLQVIELDEPIQRGETQITQVTIRRPNAGEMRGLSMVNVVQMQVDALLTLIPRICDPVLMPQELKAMNPADFMQIGTVIAQYYVPKDAGRTWDDDPVLIVDDIEEVMANVAITFPGFISLDRMERMSAEELIHWHDLAVKRSENA